MCHVVWTDASQVHPFLAVSPPVSLAVVSCEWSRSRRQDIQTIHEEFLAAFDKFKTVKYDLLDVDDPTFDVDFGKFRDTIKDFDRRLGSVLTTTFEDGVVIYGTFKVVDSFDELLGRTIIHNEWLKKQGEVIQAYWEDLQVCGRCPRVTRLPTEQRGGGGT